MGIGVAVALLSRQQLSISVKGIYLNGMITTDRIPLRVVVGILNKTIARVLVRSIAGALISDGRTVATINQTINKRIGANSGVEQNILIDVHGQEAIAAILANVKSGDINNLAFDFIGEIVVGEQWPVGVKFEKVFTWNDIQQML